MRYWLWLFYPPRQGEDLAETLKPWRRWGSVSGSGSDAREADISWEYRSLATAERKMEAMHDELRAARIPHRMEIVDTADHSAISVVVARVGRWRGRKKRR